MRPGGLVIISTPDHDVYSPPGSPPNPYHVREFTQQEFSDLLEKYFANRALLLQRSIVGSAILPEKPTPRSCRPLVFERQQEQFHCGREMPDATYLIALASDAALPTVGVSLYMDRDHFLRTDEALNLARADAQRARDEMQALRSAGRDANIASLIQHLEGASHVVTHTLNLMAESRADLGRRLDAVTTRAVSLDEVRLALSKDLAAGHANAVHAVNHIAGLEKQVAGLEAARADLTHQLGQAQTRTAELLAGQNASLRQVEEAQSHAGALRLQVQAAEAQAKQQPLEFEHQIDERASQVELLITEIKTLRADLNQAFLQHNAAEQQLRATSQETISALQRECRAACPKRTDRASYPSHSCTDQALSEATGLVIAEPNRGRGSPDRSLGANEGAGRHRAQQRIVRCRGLPISCRTKLPGSRSGFALRDGGRTIRHSSIFAFRSGLLHRAIPGRCPSRPMSSCALHPARPEGGALRSTRSAGVHPRSRPLRTGKRHDHLG